MLEKPWKIKLITEPFFLVNLWKKVRNVENLIKEKPGLLSGTLSTVCNLPKEDFPVEEIKKVYAMRWGIETSFRELKYAIGLCCFHSKKVEYIMQEIYARLILYNYCELITMHVIIQQKGTKHVYQMNYTIAIHICRYFLRNDISPPDVETLIQKNLLPVRPGRSDPRKVKPKSAVSFLYRVA